MTVEWGLFLAGVPIAFAIGGTVVYTLFRMNPIQRRRDELVGESLEAAEKRVAQLSLEVTRLEAQVIRLREDLAYERDLNRRLRSENDTLRLAAATE